MSLYEITLGTMYQQQLCVNRWNYETNSTPASVSGSFALASVFGGVLDEGNPIPGSIIYQIGAMVVAAVEFTDIMVKNVYDPTDFYQTPLGINGTVTGDGLPPFAAFGFRTNRTRLDIRRGTKRIVGVPEGGQNYGNLLGSSITASNAVAALMDNVLLYDDEGNDVVFNPVVVQREKVRLNPGVEPARWSYRYYDTLAEQEDHIMRSITWEAYGTVRSQTSRQYGRGQ